MTKSVQNAIIMALVFFAACGEPAKQRENETGENPDALAGDSTLTEREKPEKVIYPIPSPEQMFDFINDAGIQYAKPLMNDPSIASTYVDPSTKALNFGVYVADLAYAATYQDVTMTIELYKVVKRLGTEMNIAEMMTSEMMEKMQTNMQNPDSLAVIAGEAYYQAVDYLEANQQNGKLALMSLGGWTESLYITLNSMDTILVDSPTAQRIADQKITFGNLYTYLKTNEAEAGVREAIKDVEEIRAVFANLVEKKTTSSKTSAPTNKLVFGKGSKISITEAQFKALKKAINAYRAKIIA